jgi:hypothetical protein
MRMLLLTLLLVLGVSGGGARAAFDDGNSLLSKCSGTDYYSEGICDGYIRGVADAFEAAANFFKPFKSCVPNGITQKQLVDVAVKFLKDNPQERHTSSAAQVFVAMNKAWPCPK